MASTTIAGLSPEDARMLLAFAREWQRTRFVRPGDRKPPGNPPPIPPLIFRNDSGEVIPAYACMQITGTVEFGGRNVFTVAKPTDEYARDGAYVFNRHRPAEIGGYGKCTDGVEVHALSTSPSVASGTRLSPTIDSWYVKVNPQGKFIQAGPDDLGSEVARIFVADAGELRHVDATLKYCLLRSDATGTASPIDGSDDIEFDNIWLDDGMKDSLVKVEEYLTAGGTIAWRPVRIAKKKARWLKLQKTESSGSDVSNGFKFVSAREGENPIPCGFEVVCEFDCSCLDEGDIVYAHYDPNSDKYYTVATDAAMLGPADSMSVIDAGTSEGSGDGLTPSGCSIHYTAQPVKVHKCKQDPVEKSVALPGELHTFNVMRVVEGYGGEKVICESAVSVFTCQFGIENSVCEPVLTADDCPEINPAECGNATWTWFEDLNDWYLTAACPNGCTPPAKPSPPVGSDPLQVTSACSGTPS